jgi:hypothetical protein
MEEVIRQWSDLSPYVRFVERNYDMDDPLTLILKNICRLSRPTEPLDLEGVRAHLEAKFIDSRHNGPEYLPRYLVELLHSDLAIDTQFEHALRQPTVIKFATKHEVFVRIVAREPVVMGNGGHAGMKTSRIMVMQFAVRKGDFASIVGEDVNMNLGAEVGRQDDLGSDADGEYEMDDETLQQLVAEEK